MMDTGLLATWLPFFLMLTRCSPTSRGMKEMPGEKTDLGLEGEGKKGGKGLEGKHTQKKGSPTLIPALPKCLRQGSESKHRHDLGLGSYM